MSKGKFFPVIISGDFVPSLFTLTSHLPGAALISVHFGETDKDGRPNTVDKVRAVNTPKGKKLLCYWCSTASPNIEVNLLAR